MYQVRSSRMYTGARPRKVSIRQADLNVMQRVHLANQEVDTVIMIPHLRAAEGRGPRGTTFVPLLPITIANIIRVVPWQTQN